MTKKNLDKINPIKRDLVSRILDSIEDDAYIERIVIFGSSIRDDCTEDSDIDIAVKWKEDPYDGEGWLKPILGNSILA